MCYLVFDKCLESTFHLLRIYCIIKSVIKDERSGRKKNDLQNKKMGSGRCG